MEKDKENEDEYDKFSFYDIHSIINFYKDNWVQLILLLFVFIIIYVVDHISNINAAIFGLPSAIPGVPSEKPVKPGKKSKK